MKYDNFFIWRNFMKRYYINNTSQPNGDHEVHAENCIYLKMANDVSLLGYFMNGREAVLFAKQYCPNADGCFFCCNEAHRS